MQISCASHRTWTAQETISRYALIRCERRWRIIRKLLLFLVGALDRDVVEKNRWDDGGLRNRRDCLRDPGLATGGNDVGAQRALVQIIEGGAADQRALAVGRDAVEHARHQLTAQGLDLIDALVLLLG